MTSGEVKKEMRILLIGFIVSLVIGWLIGTQKYWIEVALGLYKPPEGFIIPGIRIDVWWGAPVLLTIWSAGGYFFTYFAVRAARFLKLDALMFVIVTLLCIIPVVNWARIVPAAYLLKKLRDARWEIERDERRKARQSSTEQNVA